MRPLHEVMLDVMKEERAWQASRRRFLSGGVKLAAGGAATMALAASPALSRMTALAQAQEFVDDIEVLNFALALEHMGFAFYRDGIDLFDLGADPFGNPINTFLADVRDHEGAHVDALSQAIRDLGGEPVQEAQYEFGYTDGFSFLQVAAALENTSVGAYDGAAAEISDPDLLITAGTIVAVEARHAAYLNLVTGVLPFPDAFETPLSQLQVLEFAGQFVVPDVATPPAQ